MVQLERDPYSRRQKTSKLKIVLADDHPLMRQALRSVLDKEEDFEIVGEVENGEQVIKLAEKAPDVIIMDISMLVVDGLEATRRIKQNNPNIGILVLTVHSDSEHVLSMLEAGADGYLTKSVFGDDVVHAIRAVASGESVLSPSVSRQVFRYAFQLAAKPARIPSGTKLTLRELEVLRLVAKGISNKEIAVVLGISLRSVKNYLAILFQKFGAQSRTEAVICSLRAGILTLEDIE